MAEQVIQQLEHAAQIVLAPHAVSQEQRLAAENAFLQFRKTKMPYAVCKQIMERSQNAYVLFQVATTIKECVVREWQLLDAADIDSLRTFLLQYVIRNPSLQNYVREQMLQTVAVIFKRGTVDSATTDRDGLFNHVTELVGTGDMSMQLVACSILTALLNEYSSTSRSSNVGLTWEFHSRCKQAFEQKDLKRVFVFCLQVLHELEKMPTPLERDVTAVFNRILSITEQVLSWEFLPKHLPRKYIGSFLGNSNVSFKPPSSWRDLVLDKGLVDMMFRVHRKIRYNSEMAHHSLQCLAQLASLNGAVFPDDKSKMNYLSNFLQAFLGMITSTQLQDYEALGIANVVHYLVLFFPISQFLSIPKELLAAFFQNLTKLTTTFGQAAAMEEALHKDDTMYMEAYEKSLDSWMTFLTDTQDLEEGMLKQYAIEIVNTYLQCHLAPPDGTRRQEVNDDDEYDEIVEDDRVRFRDQLTSIGMFARQVPEHTIPLLTQLLEDRVGRLHGQLQRIMQHGVDPANTSLTENTLLIAINEDIHWILLVAATLLTDDCEGETPMIPADIMEYSIKQSQKVDLQTTLKVLASPGNEASSFIPGSDSTDTVVRLISCVFRLCEVERRAVSARLTPHLSPQVGGTTMWFLQRWVQAYLLINENYYSQISPALQSAFGRDTEGVQWVTSYLLDKVIDNLHTWSAEQDLVTDTINLLVSLVEKRERGAYVIRCQSIWKLARQVAANQAPFDTLTASAQRHLFKALVLAGSSAIGELEDEEQFKTMLRAKRHLAVAAGDTSNINTNSPGMELMMLVFGAVQQRFEMVVSRPDLKQVMANQVVKQDILLVLECLCGVAEATRANSAAVSFDFIHILLARCAPLVDLYHNYEDVVNLVLDLLNTVANRQICYLNQTDTKKMYACCIDVIQVYAKHNNTRVIISLDAEEERYADILTLMELLTNLLSKDFIDFAVAEDEQNSANGDGGVVSAADVVLMGLNIVVPLMTVELLKFPALCQAYFRLVAYMGEIHAEKCTVLPPDLFKTLVSSVELGISSFGPDTTKLCLEFVMALGSHAYHAGPNSIPSAVCEALQHFLSVVFKMLLIDTFDMDLMETASATFFALICCNKEHYQKLVNELLAQQVDQPYYQRLVQAFNDLTPPSLQMVLARPNRIAFRNNFDSFIVNIRGFLVVK